MGRECNNEYTSKAKAALPDNDSLMMFLTISSFSLDWPPESPDNQYHLFK